jgi:hypothetical protein
MFRIVNKHIPKTTIHAKHTTRKCFEIFYQKKIKYYVWICITDYWKI